MMSVEILDGVRSLLVTPAASIEHAVELAPLLEATQARAVGCWRRTRDALELAGFLAVDEMPPFVQAEFVAQTRRVPISRREFGIVQAVTGRGPAVNHRQSGPAVGSPGWLDRFGAASSLAVPIEGAGKLRGAIAVATPGPIAPGDEVWRLMTKLAERLS
jgi:GAF domain-containing protein